MRLNNILQPSTLYITSFRSKTRPAKLWGLSSQGTEISPQNCQIEVQRPRLATNDIVYDKIIFRNFANLMSFFLFQF